MSLLFLCFYACDLFRIPETLTVRTLVKQALRSLPEEHQALKATSLEKLHCLMPVEKCGWTLDKRFVYLDKGVGYIVM